MAWRLIDVNCAFSISWVVGHAVLLSGGTKSFVEDTSVLKSSEVYTWAYTKTWEKFPKTRAPCRKFPGSSNEILGLSAGAVFHRKFPVHATERAMVIFDGKIQRTTTRARPRWPASDVCSPINNYMLCTHMPNNPTRLCTLLLFYLVSLLFPFFFIKVCLLKIFYLSRMSSILSTDCTVMFYVKRQTKLDPTCIYFEDVTTTILDFARHIKKSLSGGHKK